MNSSENISQNSDFGPNFPKEDHMISFYTQNQQNSMYRLEDISQNVDLGLKGGLKMIR